MPPSLNIRQMTRPEVDLLVDWAADEGWNPGLHDAAIFWATDPAAFVAADLDGELIGGGAITAYGREFGFMGFFIVRPAFRGRGLGNKLWHARLARLIERLKPGAAIGMDGVFDMQSYYARGGFVFSHRDLRFRLDIPEDGLGPGAGGSTIVPVSAVPFERVLDYDRTCFPAPRPAFLQAWLTQRDALALACLRGSELCGYGVARHCREGCKIGPLFANDIETADRLYMRLTEVARGGPAFLDAPENNPAAMDLVKRHAMVEVFGCARMYRGPPPFIGNERIFGVSSFELG